MDDRALKMSGGYTALPTSHLPGSVPAAVLTDHKTTEIGEANLQTFPPSNGQGRMWGYQPPRYADDPSAQPSLDGDENAQPPNGWKGFFSIGSYRPYFNVDTFDVVERIMGSLYPHHGDFIEKTTHNPDMYGPVWISTTLVFVAATLGNCASYLSFKPSSTDTQWVFDINYFLLIFPTEFLRWTVITLVGLASAFFVALNMRSYTRTASEKWMVAVVSSFVLQLCLALLIKLYFFV